VSVGGAVAFRYTAATMNVRTLLPLAALAAACAGAPRPPAATVSAARTPADFHPLAVGNEWTYRDESPGLGQPGAPRTVRILERTEDGYFRDSDRGELRADADCLHDRSRRLLCAPIAKGNSWTSVVSVSSTEKYEIAAVGETVETPAGRFEGCVRVRAHNRAGPGAELVLEITYAPGVGPVRIETFALVRGEAVPQLRAVLERIKLAGR
jgi:hypothetical protein